ncbi:hypothetical protein VQ042_15780 [Aurantimonas sp. A2-1-M11]|uniref:hypothetical protein n=1 Tax=Aurantimonas sp. A2-1-M11 TaxID=3113712 RepID=UPI002F929B1F
MTDRQQPALSSEEFREAQRELGLSDADLAFVLGIENPQHIRRLKGREGSSTHREVQPWHVRLIRAYLVGYRPGDWPGNDGEDRS